MLKFYKIPNTDIRKAILMTAQGPQCVCLIGTAKDLYEAQIILTKPSESEADKWLLLPRAAEWTSYAFNLLEDAKNKARRMYQ